MGQKRREACGWTGDAARARKSCSYYPSAAILIALETNTDTLQHREEILTHTHTHMESKDSKQEMRIWQAKKIAARPTRCQGNDMAWWEGVFQGAVAAAGGCLAYRLDNDICDYPASGLHVCVTHVRLEKKKTKIHPAKKNIKLQRNCGPHFFFRAVFIHISSTPLGWPGTTVPTKPTAKLVAPLALKVIEKLEKQTPKTSRCEKSQQKVLWLIMAAGNTTFSSLLAFLGIVIV